MKAISRNYVHSLISLAFKNPNANSPTHIEGGVDKAFLVPVQRIVRGRGGQQHVARHERLTTAVGGGPIRAIYERRAIIEVVRDKTLSSNISDNNNNNKQCR
jgi:hypothetical protein